MSSTRSCEKKKILCSSKNKKTEEDATKSKDSDFNNPKVTLSYDVLRIIFANLLARDLCNAAMVSRLWREVGEYELKHRKLIYNFVEYHTAFSDCNVKEHFNNGLINKPMLGLFFNSSSREPPDCLGHHLPRSCVTISISNPGVIGNNQEFESGNDTVAYTLLPDDPNVDIEIIIATSSQMRCINRKMDKKIDILQPHRTSYVESMISDSIKRLKGVKCMIMLTSEKFRHSKKLYNLKVFKDNIKAVWGGVVEKIFICPADKWNLPPTEDVLWLTLLISGPGIECWSTLIDHTHKIEKSVMATLMEFKKQVKLQRHTIGFMFTCVARGVDWYGGVPNVESSIFKTVFPDIPLIGSFGDGEYGIHGESETPFIDGVAHQFSTAFMILTYG